MNSRILGLVRFVIVLLCLTKEVVKSQEEGTVPPGAVTEAQEPDNAWKDDAAQPTIDEHASEAPTTVTTQENVKKVNDSVVDNRRETLKQTVEDTGSKPDKAEGGDAVQPYIDEHTGKAPITVTTQESVKKVHSLVPQNRRGTIRPTIENTRSEPDKAEGKDAGQPYIVPVEVDDIADRFKKGKKEYYFYQSKLNYYLATQLCVNKYQGRLAWIRNMELAKFLAEALSETRLDMDTLWTGGRKSSEDAKWEWQEGQKKEELSDEISLDIVTINEVEADNRHCLGFGREDYDLPQFRALACTVERSVLCESNSRPPDGNGSTHPGWITLGHYQYKIFRNRVTWDTGNVQCSNFDAHTKLGAVFSFEVAQQLGRHLLIGRPSLENAWIAGKWDVDSYKWLEVDQKIPGVTNKTTRYPPWKGNKVAKKNGCLLLDRHVSNITLFVEARCERQRAYICYRDNQNKTGGEVDKTDIIIGDQGYRLVITKMIWEDAYYFCLKYKKYESMLVEIKDDTKRHHLLYVMGDNKTAIQHIWLAGRYNTSAEKSENAWYWESDKSIIPTVDGPLQWVHNNSYSPDVEDINVCLNMDRENHKTALHYGTTCTEPQQFVCNMPKDKLLELQTAEENNNVETETPFIPN